LRKFRHSQQAACRRRGRQRGSTYGPKELAARGSGCGLFCQLVESVEHKSPHLVQVDRIKNELL
jgi:hypothetical protein